MRALIGFETGFFRPEIILDDHANPVSALPDPPAN
jgi:hypothetical protein